jgi:CRISPR/Cas system-associated exonuclease Cas4 (RecB family)
MLQLGCYAKALIFSGIEIMGVGYFSLEEEKLTGIFKNPYSLIYTGREVKKSIEDLIDDTERKIISAVETLRTGELRPNYDSQPCRYCSYKPICRYAEFKDEED